MLFVFASAASNYIHIMKLSPSWKGVSLLENWWQGMISPIHFGQSEGRFGLKESEHIFHHEIWMDLELGEALVSLFFTNVSFKKCTDFR